MLLREIIECVADISLSPPPGKNVHSQAKKQAPTAAAPAWTLLPIRVGWKADRKGKGKATGWSWGFDITRRRCEDAILLGAVGWGIWKLGYQWDEKALAGGEQGPGL
jgi:hypothetical protein